MGIGADHRADNCALCAVVAVAEPKFDGGKRGHTGSELGIAAMVFESGQPPLLIVSAVPAADDLTNRADRTSGGGDIE